MKKIEETWAIRIVNGQGSIVRHITGYTTRAEAESAVRNDFVSVPDGYTFSIGSNRFVIDKEPVKYSVEFYAKSPLRPEPTAYELREYILGGDVAWGTRPKEGYTLYRVTVEEII
jgi:hypothetical protein